MNAYELADDVKNISTAIEALEWVQKATPLLRQQADRIAELEKQVATWEKATMNARIASALKTPQTKPLSDEEINNLYVSACVTDRNEIIKRFARLIEERHGIK